MSNVRSQLSDEGWERTLYVGYLSARYCLKYQIANSRTASELVSLLPLGRLMRHAKELYTDILLFWIPERYIENFSAIIHMIVMGIPSTQANQNLIEQAILSNHCQ